MSSVQPAKPFGQVENYVFEHVENGSTDGRIRHVTILEGMLEESMIEGCFLWEHSSTRTTCMLFLL